MYKILITTTFNNGNGVAVHTVVVDFDTEDQAKIALIRSNGSNGRSYSQVAIPLY